ncbi:hypothetical protein V1512DRAFT_93458 [Lipomyces arxii]|uniref:uncharacterized protein n=1 Tax=Lipomyces arxii TaxID=56418 RepID=UPI0034CEF080
MIDSHRTIGAEMCISVEIFKIVLTYAFGWFFNSCIADQCAKNTYKTMAGLNAFLCLSGILMYIYGKRART